MPSRLSSIHIYPIKSTSPISLSNAWVDDFGLAFDRRYVLTDLRGQFVTARSHHKLCLVQASLAVDGLHLTAPDMPTLTVTPKHFSNHYQSVSVWKSVVNGQHCHASYDKWFSQYLGMPVQLLYFSSQSHRKVKNSDKSIAFADGYPLLLTSQASLTKVNDWAGRPFKMQQFRPNIVVEDCQPFEEDTWRHIRIGEVEFEVVKPCKRCIFTTVDINTAQAAADKEPLATLMKYRQSEKGQALFGQNIIPLNQGQISVNDEVVILSCQPKPILVSTPAPAEKPCQERDNASVSTNTQQNVLVCMDVVDETHDVKTFVFEKPQTMQYKAGQHLPITITIGGVEHHRNYTLSSTPTRADFITLTTKRVPEGVVSNFMHDHFAVGSSLCFSAPKGDFHSELLANKKALFISAGSGVTPMLSMMKKLVDTNAHNDIIFFHSAHQQSDIIAADEVNLLASQLKQCKISYTFTKQAKPEWQGYQGRIRQEMLSHIADLHAREVFVCGPKGFMDEVKSLLSALNFPMTQYHFESFGEPRKKAIEQATPARLSKPVTIQFNQYDKAVSGNNQDTILEQGEAAGLILPYSCRAGMCASCKVKLISGEVEVLADEGLDESEKSAGYVLACSCIPLTNVELEGEKF